MTVQKLSNCRRTHRIQTARAAASDNTLIGTSFICHWALLSVLCRKRWPVRSRPYRRRSTREAAHFKTLVEIYKIHTRLHCSKLKISTKKMFKKSAILFMIIYQKLTFSRFAKRLTYCNCKFSISILLS